MLFVLDVGNTNTVLGVFQENELKHEWHIKTDRYKTEDEFGMLIKSLFEYKEISFSDITGVIISSVVPPIMFSLERMCNIYFQIQPLIVGKDTVSSFLKINYPNPQEIGADRVVNAVGALKEHQAPLIIIDFGTATTYCYVNEMEEYEGGLILPGINISMDALYQRAAKLPKIEIEEPAFVIGQSTVEAMQAGVFYGAVAQIDGIVERIKKAKRKDSTVIATGGLAPLVGEASETIEVIDSHLTLKGLHQIYQKNR